MPVVGGSKTLNELEFSGIINEATALVGMLSMITTLSVIIYEAVQIDFTFTGKAWLLKTCQNVSFRVISESFPNSFRSSFDLIG
jgi:hypothetical protein